MAVTTSSSGGIVRPVPAPYPELMSTVCDIFGKTGDGYSPDSDRRQAFQAAKEPA